MSVIKILQEYKEYENSARLPKTNEEIFFELPQAEQALFQAIANRAVTGSVMVKGEITNLNQFIGGHGKYSKGQIIKKLAVFIHQITK